MPSIYLSHIHHYRVMSLRIMTRCIPRLHPCCKNSLRFLYDDLHNLIHTCGIVTMHLANYFNDHKNSSNIIHIIYTCIATPNIVTKLQCPFTECDSKLAYTYCMPNVIGILFTTYILWSPPPTHTHTCTATDQHTVIHLCSLSYSVLANSYCPRWAVLYYH